MEVREARTKSERTAALALRERIFCGEQGVSFEADQDGRDPEATHIVAVDDGAVIGTCRLLFRGHVARLGRLAVERDRRGDGIAAEILDDLLARRTVAGRPADLSDDRAWVRAASGRAEHDDPRLPLIG